MIFKFIALHFFLMSWLFFFILLQGLHLSSFIIGLDRLWYFFQRSSEHQTRQFSIFILVVLAIVWSSKAICYVVAIWNFPINLIPSFLYIFIEILIGCIKVWFNHEWSGSKGWVFLSEIKWNNYWSCLVISCWL